MRLLLDTHVVLAIIHGRVGELGRQVAAVVNHSDHTFFVSIATLWEVAIKCRLGKLPLGFPLERLPFALDEMGLFTVPNHR